MPPTRPGRARSCWSPPTAAGPCMSVLGFEVQTWYRTFEAPGLGPDAVTRNGPIRAFRPSRSRRPGRAGPGRDRRGPDDGHRGAGNARRHSCPRVATTAPSAASWRARRGVAVRPSRRSSMTRSPSSALGATTTPPERRVRCGILLENERGAEALEARRLDGGVARPTARARCADRVATGAALGPVQPRDGLALTQGSGADGSDGGMVRSPRCGDATHR